MANDELDKFLSQKVAEILSQKKNKNEKLEFICDLLRDNISYYNWVGFYLVEENPDVLVLKAFSGERTEHVRIQIGKGICGQAAKLRRTLIVQDVTKETNYLSCNSKVKSEIVIPIFKKDKVVGELDVDSHSLSPFTQSDKKLLTRIASMVSENL